MNLTSAQLRELSLRRSQQDLQDLLQGLNDDGEILVVDEAEESEEPSGDAPDDDTADQAEQPVDDGA